MLKLLLVENSIAKMSNFSCSSKDVGSDLTTPLLVHKKEKTRENVAESMRGKRFTNRELAIATKKFNNVIGEGDYGFVYKGVFKSGEVVAVKQLKQETQDFNVEILMLNHPNLVTYIDYCTDGDQRLLVYEYMPLGSLKTHLFDPKPNQETIAWDTRLKIAIGAARGLEYLHCKINPPIIHCNLKSSDILLDNDFNPKLSDIGLKFPPPGGKAIAISSTYGYCPLEYVMTGNWTLKSDIYSFGVVLLELITGRKAVDMTKKHGERNLAVWSRPFLKDPKTCIQLVDPLLQSRFPVLSVQRVVALTAMCLEEKPTSRPSIDQIVVGLEDAASQP